MYTPFSSTENEFVIGQYMDHERLNLSDDTKELITQARKTEGSPVVSGRQLLKILNEISGALGKGPLWFTARSMG